MITELLTVAATAIISGAVTAAVQHYRYTERRDLLNRIDAAQLLTEQRQTAVALDQAEEGRRLAAWGGYYQAWDNDLHHREQQLRHRADKSEDEPVPPEEPAEQEPAARSRFEDLPPSARRHMAVVNQIDAVAAHYVGSSETGIDAEMARILAGVDMNRDLVALLERKEALRTPTSELPPVKRGDDEMPVPTPPTKPAVVKLPSKRKASKHAVAAGKAA